LKHNHDSLNIGEAIQLGRKRVSAGSDTPWLDLQVLIAHITGQPRAWVLAHPESPLTAQQAADLSSALKQLEEGIPLPYVLGAWEFFGQSFLVNPSVLIPRPETEILVETAIQWLLAQPGKRLAADTGTGSGCIAISLAIQVPDLQVTATDISIQALEIARTNATRHLVASQVTCLQGDLLEPFERVPTSLPVQFDLMVANLPYIPSETLKTLAVFEREPQLALDGGKDGLDVLRRYLAQAPKFLAPEGLILMEIEANQGESALELAQAHFPGSAISLHSDLGGHDRLLQIQS
jgi:release factor glutamine methyltransferase